MECKLADVLRPEGVHDQEYMISIQARKRPATPNQGGMMAG
jgi:hypothetical protein